MPGANLEVPFQPIRNDLYTSLELMDGFAPDDPDSTARTLDFRCYRYFVASGAAAPSDPYAGMMEALHDHSIMRAMSLFLDEVDVPSVAIMGDHKESRDTPTYGQIVEIARRLTQRGCLVASGGGPGAMEATHLGALLANASDDEVGEAKELLQTVPKLPASTTVVSDDGIVDMKIVGKLHNWAKPAFELAQRYMSNGGQSLAVPTWYYGSEPVSPLATRVAKYFQNSIREDVLLTLAANGIVYTAGAAGTLQEVFQGAAQNYYRKKHEAFAPMIFFGAEFWTNTMPVLPVLEALFVGNKNLSPQDFKRLVAVVDTVDEAVDRLFEQEPSKQKTATRMEAKGFGPMMAAARSLQKQAHFSSRHSLEG